MKNATDSTWLAEETDAPDIALDDGSRVAVIGGGPAGSLFSYFLMALAERTGIEITVDLYEPRDFTRPGPHGCNMCGGIISESLVQNLLTEGIDLPPTVVQRGIDSYVLHTDAGSVRIETPLQEKRIAAIHRGPGPRDVQQIKWDSFDGYLQRLATEKGAHLIRQIVDEVDWNDGRPVLKTRDGDRAEYDLVTVAVGVNARSLKLLGHNGFEYQPPRTTKTFIREYFLGEKTVESAIGSSMHVFLLNLPRLEFAAIIPKGDYVTVCMLGEDIDKKMVAAFLESPEVRSLLPVGTVTDRGSCQCAPRMYTLGAVQPFANRILFIGDCGVSRLYKDGIGAAYRTAKAAAATAVFQGISERSFRRHFWPVCKALRTDNRYGKLTFAVTREIQKRGFARRALVRMTAREQARKGSSQRMSRVLWDVFTGSEAYRNIFKRMLHPAFVGHLFWNLIAAAVPVRQRQQ